jgi:hypothetical protein
MLSSDPVEPPPSCRIVPGVNALSLLYPQVFEVAGAGSAEANGRYLLAGVKNGRPYYEKRAGKDERKGPGGKGLKPLMSQQGSRNTALWYFETSVPLISSYNGWFISKHVRLCNKNLIMQVWFLIK